MSKQAISYTEAVNGSWVYVDVYEKEIAPKVEDLFDEIEYHFTCHFTDWDRDQLKQHLSLVTYPLFKPELIFPKYFTGIEDRIHEDLLESIYDIGFEDIYIDEIQEALKTFHPVIKGLSESLQLAIENHNKWGHAIFSNYEITLNPDEIEDLLTRIFL